MALKKEYLYKLIDNLPQKKYHELADIIQRLSIPEEEPTEDEKKAIEQAQNEYKNGETYSYTIDELRKEFL